MAPWRVQGVMVGVAGLVAGGEDTELGGGTAVLGETGTSLVGDGHCEESVCSQNWGWRWKVSVRGESRPRDADDWLAE